MEPQLGSIREEAERTYRYVKANTAITPGSLVAIDTKTRETIDSDEMFTRHTSKEVVIGLRLEQEAVKAGEFCWFNTFGPEWVVITTGQLIQSMLMAQQVAALVEQAHVQQPSRLIQ